MVASSIGVALVEKTDFIYRCRAYWHSTNIEKSDKIWQRRYRFLTKKSEDIYISYEYFVKTSTDMAELAQQRPRVGRFSKLHGGIWASKRTHTKQLLSALIEYSISHREAVTITTQRNVPHNTLRTRLSLLSCQLSFGELPDAANVPIVAHHPLQDPNVWPIGWILA